MTTTTLERPSLAAMAALWRSGGDAKLPYNISHLTYELKKFGIDTNKDGEQMLLVGSRNVARHLWENSEGALIAVAPGVIICHTSAFADAGRYCTGLITRLSDVRYEVDVFAQHNGEHIYGNASIQAGPGPVDHREAAAVFFWGFGRDEGSSVGMTGARWSEMQPWIDRWLTK